eukprot:2011636-Rhodomonas_salina.4
MPGPDVVCVVQRTETSGNKSGRGSSPTPSCELHQRPSRIGIGVWCVVSDTERAYGSREAGGIATREEVAPPYRPAHGLGDIWH